MGRPAEDFLLRRYPNSPFWYYRLKGWNNFKSTGQKTKAAAKSYALQKWKKLQESNLIRPDVKVGEFIKGFFLWESPWCIRQRSKGKLLESTAKWRHGLLTHHIEPHFKKYRLDEVTPGMVDDWLLSLKVSSQTKDHIRTTLRIIFREALRERYIQSNPMDFVEREKIIHASNEPPTMDELRKLFPEDHEKFKEIWPLHHYGVMCALTASTGLRMQEVRALTRKSIVMDKQGVIVAKAVKTDGTVGLPKADEIRVVLAPQETIDLLSWWFSIGNIHSDDQLLFPGREGWPIDRKAPYKYFKQALVIAEIDAQGRKLTVHGLRHAYNTRIAPDPYRSSYRGILGRNTDVFCQ